jgi:hypothetical protein
MNFTLLAARVPAPMTIAPFHEWVFPDGVLSTQFYRTDTGYLLRFTGLADFEVSADARTVSCHPVPEASVETVRHLYLNQVLPLCLSKLGRLVFHGSAVEVEGGAVAFVAESGRGKSTLAASFSANGFRFLTDDGLVVDEDGEEFLVEPSDPSLRLWTDSQDAIVCAGVQTASPVTDSFKTRFGAGNEFAFCQEPRPLRRVYFLGDGSAPVVTFARMSPTDMLMEWVRHSFFLDFEDRSVLASHFFRVANLANRPLCYRLDYPRHFEHLASLRTAIIEHLRFEGRTAA